MTKIDITDKIFVSVSDRGRCIFNLTLSGITSLKQLMQQLNGLLHQYRGKLLTLELRNSTRGWRSENQLLIAA